LDQGFLVLIRWLSGSFGETAIGKLPAFPAATYFSGDFTKAVLESQEKKYGEKILSRTIPGNIVL
jgi:hypothetical protein